MSARFQKTQLGCLMVLIVLTAQHCDQEKDKTDLSVLHPLQVPDFYVEILNDHLNRPFERNLGNGRFLHLWRYRENPQLETLTFSTFAEFRFPLDEPCPRMVVEQKVKRLQFVKSENRFIFEAMLKERVDIPPQPTPEWDPGEVLAEGSLFKYYDVPGVALPFGNDLGGELTAHRVRMVFCSNVICRDTGRTLKRFYWMIEHTIPFRNRQPDLDALTSKVMEITEQDYQNAKETFGQDHADED